MQVKSVAIFGVSYAVLCVAQVVLLSLLARVYGLQDVSPDLTKNVGAVVNVLSFFFSISLALSRSVHNLPGRASGPLAFRKSLLDQGKVLILAIALTAVSVDFLLITISTWYFAVEVKVPAVYRLVIMTCVYSAFAWFALDHQKTRGIPIGGR